MPTNPIQRASGPADTPAHQPTSSSLRTLAVRLDAMSGVIGIAVAQWAARDDSKPQPEIRHAANVAMASIDDMLTTLHRARQQLVTEIRKADDATAARVDAMLAGLRAVSPIPDSEPEVSFKLTSGQSQADPATAAAGARS